MANRTTVDIIRDVLAKRCSQDLADRCASSIESAIIDLDTDPIYMDCKVTFKLDCDEYPIIETWLRGEPDAKDIMAEIKTRVHASLNQKSVIDSTQVKLDDAVIEGFLNAGFTRLR